MNRDGEGIPLTGPSGRAYPRRQAGNAAYTRYHPRWYRRRMPIFWWLGKGAYTAFIVRELTSLFVAYAAGVLVLFVRAVGAGPEAYEAFLGWLSHPAIVFLHAFVLLALLVHAITWLNLAPKALVVRVGGGRLPAGAVAAGHYAAWALVSAVLAWVILGRGG